MGAASSDIRQVDRWFDYLVLGAGSAGCAVAGRLARAGHKVALVEAGSAFARPWSRMPLGNALQVPKQPGLNNWKYETAPEPGLNYRRGYQPRGRVLGGSSAINGMIYLRGRPDDYDRWLSMGNRGWGWNDVRPVFESFERPDGDINSVDADDNFGVAVSICRSHSGADEIFFSGAKERGLRRLNQREIPNCEAVFPFRFSQYGSGQFAGRRCSSADAFLHSLPREQRPHVFCNTLVDYLAIAQGKATHVMCRRGRNTLRLGARQEIILCAGAFGSPAILQRSGVGPAKLLKKCGVEIVRDMSEVGQNLQDHLQCGLHYSCRDNRFMGLTPGGVLDLAKAIWTWRKMGRGWGSSTFTQSGGYLKSDENRALPDLQCHFFSGIVRDHGNRLHAARGYSAHVYVVDPDSRGSVEIASSNVRTPPRITPNYLSHLNDLRRTRVGLKRLQHILDAPAFRALDPAAIADIRGFNDPEIDTFIRSNADTAYHPVGTCRMGCDTNSVVDNNLRLRGIEGVRIADASIMPRIVSSNTNAASIMIGIQAAEFILKRG
ncbi:GMC family oxidoreductase [Phaeobacter sp. C3_T13_0]|uniref:GMC family oxidoreductase n=1 Tax=Phaeobacter cretensis TaxID=3342641 RepID=UPI0039BC2E51